MIDRRPYAALLVMFATHLLGGALAHAQVLIDHEYEYKAAYLYHFAGLCTWPDEEENRDNGPIIVGVLGPNRFGQQLERIRVQSANLPRRIEPRVFAQIPQEPEERRRLQQCHLLFVSSGATAAQTEQRLRGALRIIEGPMTLVFTEIEDSRFFRDPTEESQGVTANFYIEDNLLKLLLNLRSIPDGVDVPERLQELRTVTLRR